MRNRREFLKTVGGVAAGAIVAGGSLSELIAQEQGGRGGGRGRGADAAAAGGANNPRNPAANPPSGPVPRKIVQVAGKRVRVIDVHAHATVEEVVPILKGTEYERQAGGRAMGE